MNSLLLLAIAFGLAMDSFAVAVAKSVAAKFRLLASLKMALAFAFAHAIMVLIGWACGTSISSFVSGIDHWVAFTLLSFIGVRMIYEYFANGVTKHIKGDGVNLKTLLMLSIATSIDALIIGVSFAFMKVDIIDSALIIAAVIFVLTLLGVVAGKNFHKVLGKKSEIFGGLVLIAIGLKTLIDHL